MASARGRKSREIRDLSNNLEGRKSAGCIPWALHPASILRPRVSLQQAPTFAYFVRTVCFAVATTSWILAVSGATAAVDEIRMSVDPAVANTVSFAPVRAKLIRLVIHKSHRGQPCFDELEVYGPGNDNNLAAAKRGAKATASSCLEGYATHRIEYLNDGKYGNSNSWIAAAPVGWAQIELPQAVLIDRVVFSRDRSGRHVDRVPASFEVQVSLDGQAWQTVTRVASTNLVTVEALPLFPHRPTRLELPPQSARCVRLVINKTSGGAPCVDELEVYGTDDKQNLALAAAGAKASASSCIEGYAIHQIANLNDGKYTNAHSWIADGPAGWAQIELPQLTEVHHVVLSRDRSGKYRDRMVTDFEIQLSTDGAHWNTVKKVKALAKVAIDRPLPSETPQQWGERIVLDLPAGFRARAEKLLANVRTMQDVQPLLALDRLDNKRQSMAKRLALELNPAALRRAVADLAATYPTQYRPPADFDARLAAYERQVPEILGQLKGAALSSVEKALARCEEMFAFQRTVLLANPLLDFDELLVLKRKTPESDQDHTYWKWGQKYGMTVNWSCDFRPKNPPVAPWWDEAIVAFSLSGARASSGSDAAWRTVFKAEPTHMLQHPELHFDADRLLFAMPGPKGAFQVFEVNCDGTGLRQITRDTGPDIDNGDPCYLPDGRIIFNSTRAFIGVPCEDGNSYVTNLCIMDADGSNTRMLAFDQESNWYPTLLNDGRVLYTRYEYANISHQFGRLLFRMNPDGTGQMEYYGSNSYWPNSIFYARPIPNHPTMVAGVVCGHHGPNRTGRLVLFDPARGRQETAGAVQTIPGYGKKVERIVEDHLYGGDWPKFVHPWPLSEKYFLASARLSPEQVEYGIYLVDVFDNVTEICRLPDYSLLEPIPLRPRPAPRAIPDRIQPKAKDATILLLNIYEGPGLAGVPRGTVKRLRLFTYNYVYRHTSKRGFGHLATPGVDGPWEPRYILGTVPVSPDGSAMFKVPANTPIALQPLDDQGRALQMMRSWYTAMPGESISCVGCHEQQSYSPTLHRPLAAQAGAAKIEPWRGPSRGFDFELEVQPVLDRYCVGCHDGSDYFRPDWTRKTEQEKRRINHEYHRATESSISTILTPSFIALHPYIRRAHAESNYALQTPGDYLADTSPLIQMLQKGHHNVRLDREAWDRLYTWIDLGAPDHGSWKNSEWGVPENYYERRREMLARYAGRTDDVEWLPAASQEIPQFVPPPEEGPATAAPDCPGWPFDAQTAASRQAAVGLPTTITVPLGNELSIELALVPPGEFLLGATGAAADEQPVTRVQLERPFYMSRHEVTNAQFAALCGSEHCSGHVGWRSIDWRGEGYPLSDAKQPVVRVSWFQAMQFCNALAAKIGRTVTLPSEVEWEWACRAGSGRPLWYGGLDDDFSPFENLAGREQQKFAFHGKRKWYLRDDRFDDGAMVSAAVGSYRPNPWGLYDMAGNVSEWTRSSYRPYPYNSSAEDSASTDADKVVRGGSWYTRPRNARSAYRWKYPPWRRVFNVGFRVVLPQTG